MTWIALFLFVALTAGAERGRWASSYRLATESQTTTGTVTELHLGDHGGCSYDFIVDEVTYSGRDGGCGVDRQTGDSLPVTYLPSHPQTSLTGSARMTFEVLIIIQLGAPTLMAALVTMGLAWQQGRKLGWVAPTCACAAGAVLLFGIFAT